MENQPKPLKTYKIQHGTMKKPIWNHLEPGWLWVVQMVTGDFQEEVLIFRDTQTPAS